MKLSFFLCLILAFNQLYAQNLVYDPVFPVGGGATNGIFTMLPQADGRIILGGAFPIYNGVNGRGLVRILPNGQRDPGFNIGTGVATRVQELAAGPNGRLYAAGLFTSFNGTTVGDFVCLDSNGTIDPSFVAGTGFNNEVTALAVYPNGDIVVGGFFNQYKGQSVTQPVRIFANGQRDTTFNLGGSGSFGIIDAVCIQPDNKILVAGTITQYNGQAAGRLIRLNPNGSRDSTFDLGLLFSGPINEIYLQADGRILAGGTFTSVNGLPMSRIARILPNGQPDPGFTPGTGFNSTVRTVRFTGEGQIALGGDFTSFNGIATNRIALLDTNGNLAFGTGNCTMPNGTIYAIVSNADQSLVIGGVFSQLGTVAVQRIARLTRASSQNAASLPTIAASTTTLSCQAQPVTLQLTAGNLNGASNWHWYSGSCGGTALGQATSITVFPVVTTTYYVRGEGNCIAPGPCQGITIVVQDTQPPVPAVTNLPTIQLVCGMAITPALANDNCSGNMVGVANRSLVFNTPGNYTVVWTYTDSAGNSSSQSQAVIVDTLDTRISYVNLELRAFDTTYTAYQWVRCDLAYTPISQATSARFTPTNTGDYALIFSQFSCVDTSVCLNVTFSNVGKVSWENIQLYPNPTRNEVFVSTAISLQLRLLDLQSKVVFETEVNSETAAIRLPDLQKGLYLWEIRSAEGVQFRKQLIQ